MNPKDARKPEIKYPCDWGYKVIGHREDQVRAAVEACLSDEAYSLVISRSSAGGKYLSLNLTLTVVDEAHRHTVFAALAKHPHIKMVI